MDRSGFSYVNRMIPMPIASACIFFVAAWRLDIVRAWVYFGLFLLLHLANIALLARCNVELLNERGKTQADVYGPDKTIMAFYLLFQYGFAPAAAGIELGRLHAGRGNAASIAVGIALLVVSGALENWATYVNRFFERSIRLQKDRHQTVVTDGPYGFVRHPGYLSYILRLAAFPLVLGSAYAVLPILVSMLLLVIRTRLEDALLMGNLPGYGEYARKVKYRLLPPLW